MVVSSLDSGILQSDKDVNTGKWSEIVTSYVPDLKLFSVFK